MPVDFYSLRLCLCDKIMFVQIVNSQVSLLKDCFVLYLVLKRLLLLRFTTVVNYVAVGENVVCICFC